MSSYDIASAHHRVWASTLWSTGYDASYRDGTPAYWALWAPDGKAWRVESLAAGEKPASLLNRRPHVFVTFDDLDAYARKHHGVVGWRHDKWDGWHPADPDTGDRPCGVTITNRGRISRFSVCGKRRKKGLEICGHHDAHARRRAERAAASREQSERSDSGLAIAEDAVQALATIDVAASTHYQRPWGSGLGSYTGEVLVHAEDVMALVKELRELRTFKEFA